MTILEIEGMTCGHCAMHVKEALAAVPGVEHVVEVSLEGHSATVEGAADTGALIAAVREAGYEAKVA